MGSLKRRATLDLGPMYLAMIMKIVYSNEINDKELNATTFGGTATVMRHRSDIVDCRYFNAYSRHGTNC